MIVMAYGNFQKKTTIFQNTALLFVCIALTGCADWKILNDLTGEPEAGPMANRAGILRVDSREAAWPNLSSVPPRPAPMAPKAQREAQLQALEAQRRAGLGLLQALPPAAASASAP